MDVGGILNTIHLMLSLPDHVVYSTRFGMECFVSTWVWFRLELKICPISMVNLFPSHCLASGLLTFLCVVFGEKELVLPLRPKPCLPLLSLTWFVNGPPFWLVHLYDKWKFAFTIFDQSLVFPPLYPVHNSWTAPLTKVNLFHTWLRSSLPPFPYHP